jgi:hypothetical protein
VDYQGTSLAWGIDPYRGPETTRFFEDHVPLFAKIAYFNGYMLGSIDNALFASELGLLGLWEMKPIWMSDSEVIMIRPVESGVFVSNLARTFFMRGLEPKEFKEEKVATYPAIEWSVAHNLVDSSKFLDASLGLTGGMSALWMSKEGLCLGLSTGLFLNLTQARLAPLTEGNTGATLAAGNTAISTILR